MNYTNIIHYVFIGGIVTVVLCSAGIIWHFGPRWEKTKKYTYSGFFLCHAICLLPVVLLPWIHTLPFPVLAAIICIVPFIPGLLFCNYHSYLFSHDPILLRAPLRYVAVFVSAALPVISFMLLLNAGSADDGYATPIRWIMGLITVTSSGYVLLTLVMLYNQWYMESFFSVVTPRAIQVYIILACLFLGAWLIFLLGLSVYHAFMYAGFTALIIIPIVHLFITLRLIKDGDLYLSVTIPAGMNAPLFAPQTPVQEYRPPESHTMDEDDSLFLEEIALSQIATDIVRKSKIIHRHLSRTRHEEEAQQKQPEKKRAPELSPAIDVQDLRDALLRKLKDEKVYLDENITITTLANDLNIEPYQLSRFINYHLHTRFNTLINTWRIKDAKKLLAQEPGQTILDIAFAVGFNSKASFNRVFKKITGMTPTDYRENEWGKKS